jgi:hypothetical protein
LLGELGRDVLHHSAAHLRRLPLNLEILNHDDARPRGRLLGGGRDRGRRGPLSPLLHARGLEHDAMSLVVALGDLDLSLERHLHGTQLDRDLALPMGVVHRLGEVRAGHARHHALDVEQVVPGPSDACRHFKRVLQEHRNPPLSGSHVGDPLGGPRSVFAAEP